MRAAFVAGFALSLGRHLGAMTSDGERLRVPELLDRGALGGSFAGWPLASEESVVLASLDAPAGREWPSLGAPVRVTGEARRRAVVDVLAYYESMKLGTVTEDALAADFSTGASSVLGDFDLDDVERRRTGLEFRVGIEAIEFDAIVFQERFEPFDTFDLIGVGLGLRGTPRLQSGRDVSPILDFGANVSVASGDGDVAFVDSLGNDFFVDGDIVALAEQLRLGAGLDVFGVQVAFGLLADFVQGRIDVGVDDDIGIKSSNSSGYVRVAYRGRDVPIYASAEVYGGGLTGFAFQLGFRF